MTAEHDRPGDAGSSPGSGAGDGPGPGATEDATRVRDHLANERTFLAWLRTGAAVMALGLAIAGLGTASQSVTIAAGSLLVAAGAVGVGYGALRYREVADQIEARRFTVGSRGRGAVIASVVLVLAVLGALIILIVGGR